MEKIKEIIKKWEELISEHPSSDLYSKEFINRILTDFKAVDFPKEEENPKDKFSDAEIQEWANKKYGSDSYGAESRDAYIRGFKKCLSLQSKVKEEDKKEEKFYIGGLGWVNPAGPAQEINLNKTGMSQSVYFGMDTQMPKEEPKKYDFVCDYSKEGFIDGDICYIVWNNMLDEEPTRIVFSKSNLEGRAAAYFHTKESALEWNRKKFGAKEEPKTLEERVGDLEIQLNTVLKHLTK